MPRSSKKLLETIVSFVLGVAAKTPPIRGSAPRSSFSAIIWLNIRPASAALTPWLNASRTGKTWRGSSRPWLTRCVIRAFNASGVVGTEYLEAGVSSVVGATESSLTRADTQAAGPPTSRISLGSAVSSSAYACEKNCSRGSRRGPPLTFASSSPETPAVFARKRCIASSGGTSSYNPSGNKASLKGAIALPSRAAANSSPVKPPDSVPRAACSCLSLAASRTFFSGVSVSSSSRKSWENRTEPSGVSRGGEYPSSSCLAGSKSMLPVWISSRA